MKVLIRYLLEVKLIQKLLLWSFCISTKGNCFVFKSWFLLTSQNLWHRGHGWTTVLDDKRCCMKQSWAPERGRDCLFFLVTSIHACGHELIALMAFSITKRECYLCIYPPSEMVEWLFLLFSDNGELESGSTDTKLKKTMNRGLHLLNNLWLSLPTWGSLCLHLR